MMVKFNETAPFVGVEYVYDVDKILHKEKSQYQDIMVIENPKFGRMLILDNVVQITDRDEFLYHEMLTHIAMHAHPNPRRVIVIGGGDGGTVREVLKHDSVERVYFVEIDRRVIDVSKEFFPKVACGVDDPRVEIRCMDGAEFVKTARDIDVVIVDSTDPIGFARTLFADAFFNAIKGCLTKDGFYVTHTESLILHADIVTQVQQSITKIFPVVGMYTQALATYPGNWWTFVISSMGLDPKVVRRPYKIETRYYTDEIHTHSFVPPRFYKRILDGEINW